METILQRTNHITMFIAFGVSWILVNTAVGSIVCDNTFSDIISKRGGVNALEKYYENLSPTCRLWQSKMDSNFIWHEMSFGEAAIYAGSISVLGAIIELTYLDF